MKKIIVLITLVLILLISGSAQAQTISVSPSIPSTSPGTTATFTVSINGNTADIGAVGFRVIYNTNMLQYQGVSKGVLTQNWYEFQGNEVVPGGVIVGGWTSTGSEIPPFSSGSIAVVNMMVTCSGCTVQELGQFCVTNYDDHLNEFTPEPACIQQFDYCQEDIQGPLYTDWTLCNTSDSQSRTVYYEDLNYDSCCLITGLVEDCHIKNPAYKDVKEDRYCDYCTPNWVEVNNSFGCGSDDKISAYFVDTNECYQKTWLPSDWDSRPENKIYSCDFCTPDWLCDGYGACQSDDREYCNSVWDTNNCYPRTWLPSDDYNGDYSEFTPNICDYCIPSWTEVTTACNPDDTFTGWYDDTNNCYGQTGLASDNNPPQNNTYVCDFCTPNWIEVNATCQSDDTITGYHTDSNSCFAQTGLGSDNNPPANNTYSCDFCTPVWTCSVYGECQPDNLQFCESVTDTKSCFTQTGLQSDQYTGNYLEFNQSCEYGNYTGPGTTFNTTSGRVITIDALGDAGTSIDIFALQNTTGNTINITRHADNPENETVAGMNPLGKYIVIEVTGDIENNIGWVVIRIYYTDQEVSGAGINEDSLRIYYWNESESVWELTNSQVNVAENYVWTNTTHFSLYGLYGEQAPYCGDGSCDGGETCSSCPNDCGSCPPPSNPGPTGGIISVPPKTEEPCEEDWLCTGWSDCINGRKTRECTDLNECETEEDRPSETMTCTTSSPSKGFEICREEPTYAISPEGECKRFENSCDVPDEWLKLESCPPPAGQSGSFPIGINTVIMGVIIASILLIIGVAFFRPKS